MANIIITSHGTYATGIMDTLKYFSGDLENVYCLALADKSIYDFQKECQAVLAECQGETIVLADFYQGTPFRTFFEQLIGRKDAKIISNISFVHALTAILNKEQNLDTIASEVMNAGGLEETEVAEIVVAMSADDE